MAQAAAPASNGDPACVAMMMPTVRGVPGNAPEVAGGVRDLVDNYLASPSLKVVPLEARLPSLAVAEAREKGCQSLLYLVLSRKSGGSPMMKALGQAACTSSWYLPGGGSTASAAARTAASVALQTAASLASSTKAKDEKRLEYRLQSPDGQVQFGPKTETQTATVDGEDLLTPVAVRTPSSTRVVLRHLDLWQSEQSELNRTYST